MHYRKALLNLTTPESHAAWGDFTEVAQALDNIEDWGTGSMVEKAFGDPDVAYAKVLRGVDRGYEVLDDQILEAAAAITLVWRPSFGQWMVNGFGQSLRPEEVPHG